MSLRSSIPDAWRRFQGELPPALAGEVGPLGVRHTKFIAVLDLVEGVRHVHHGHRGVGNPPADRRALARAFVGRAVRDMPTTAVPVDRLLYDPTLRRPVGWSRVSEVPGEPAFSRAPPGSRRPVCRSGCTGRRAAPTVPARSSATYRGTPQRPSGGRASMLEFKPGSGFFSIFSGLRVRLSRTFPQRSPQAAPSGHVGKTRRGDPGRPEGDSFPCRTAAVRPGVRWWPPSGPPTRGGRGEGRWRSRPARA